MTCKGIRQFGRKERKTDDLTGEKTGNEKGDGDSRKLGERGEIAASKYLERQGYRILEHNYRIRSGEIDIVAIEGEEDGRATLVFVEVKTRRNLNFGVPSLAVNYEKRRHLLKAAAYYMHRYGLDNVQARFDVIEILRMNGKTYIRHTRNAFS